MIEDSEFDKLLITTALTKRSHAVRCHEGSEFQSHIIYSITTHHIYQLTNT